MKNVLLVVLIIIGFLLASAHQYLLAAAWFGLIYLVGAVSGKDF
jgi:hypothetical protein